MSRSAAISAVLLLACGTPSDPDAGRDAGEPCATGPIPELTAVPLEGGPFTNPLFLGATPADPSAVYVVEQLGTIRRIEAGVSTLFLDITDRSHCCGETGTLGLAFHPDYATNGRYFVYYTELDTLTNVVAEYHRDMGNTELARLIEQPDLESNHNGGMIAFGPDGYLYVATGDGGNGGDSGAQHAPIGNALSRDTLFGKILRLDVDAPERDYAAPGNPFEADGGLPQIWHYGLRNPWRFSFDRETGDFWLGDVGQGNMEEIDFRAHDDPPLANFGWRAWEGTRVFDMALIDMGLADDHVPPVFVLDRALGGESLLSGPQAIIGGYVYRGRAIPALRGAYVFGDAFSPDIGAFRYCDRTVTDAATIPGLRALGNGLASLGEDNDGELYLVYLYSGQIFRIEAP